MDIAGSIIALMIAWWIVFQAIVSMGTQSPSELNQATGDFVGDPAAPITPALFKKALWSAGIAILIWAILFWTFNYSGLSFQSL